MAQPAVGFLARVIARVNTITTPLSHMPYYFSDAGNPVEDELTLAQAEVLRRCYQNITNGRAHAQDHAGDHPGLGVGGADTLVIEENFELWVALGLMRGYRAAVVIRTIALDAAGLTRLPRAAGEHEDFLENVYAAFVFSLAKMTTRPGAEATSRGVGTMRTRISELLGIDIGRIPESWTTTLSEKVEVMVDVILLAPQAASLKGESFAYITDLFSRIKVVPTVYGLYTILRSSLPTLSIWGMIPLKELRALAGFEAYQAQHALCAHPLSRAHRADAAGYTNAAWPNLTIIIRTLCTIAFPVPTMEDFNWKAAEGPGVVLNGRQVMMSVAEFEAKVSLHHIACSITADIDSQLTDAVAGIWTTGTLPDRVAKGDLVTQFMPGAEVEVRATSGLVVAPDVSCQLQELLAGRIAVIKADPVAAGVDMMDRAGDAIAASQRRNPRNTAFTGLLGAM